MRLRSSRPGNRKSRKGLSLSAGLLTTFALGIGALGVGASSAYAQATEVDDHVAAALYDRGMVLYEQGDVANAKTMFGESLERSSKGNRAGDALRMLRSCNEKLGITDLDAGRPAQSDGPLDPYADPQGSGEGPLDPYGAGEDGQSGTPLDPYGSSEGDLGTGPGQQDQVSPWSKRGLYAFGGASGFIAGMALVGPYEDTNGNGSVDTLKGGAVLAGIVGAGGSAYLSYYLADKLPLSDSESAAVASTGFWGAYNFAQLGNVFTGDSTDANDIYKSLLLGELAGAGVGYWYAKSYSPTEGDLAFTNSFSIYGTTAGLLLGLAMDPPKGDAYSLNASLGSLAGIGTGLYLADRANASRERMLKVDLGAAAGALIPWVLIYPLAADANSNSDTQLTGFLSTLTMGAGAYLVWHLTEDKDEGTLGETPSLQDAPSPALYEHGGQGGWSLGTPIVRPMDLPELLPKQGLSLGVDVLSGRF